MMQRVGRWLQVIGAAVMVFSSISGATTRQGVAESADLTNLTFTATGTLTARFVSPEPQDSEPIPAVQVTVATQLGAGVALSVNGTPVDTKLIGKRTVDKKTGETQYVFYGVPLVAGPNTLEAQPIGAGGALGPKVDTTVFGPGDAATIRAEFVQRIVADGKSVVPLNVTILDRFGHAAAPSQRVDVSILRGDVRFADAAPATTDGALAEHLPLPVGGYLQLHLLPGTVAGPFEIEIQAGSASLRRTYYIEPYVRPAFVTGIVSVGAGSTPVQVDGDGTPDNGNAGRGRAAIFASGALGRSLVTIAYESQNRLSPLSSYGSAAQDPNGRPYLTYGDASQVTNPYHSDDHLYARIDRGQSSAMWGAYTARVGPADVGTYQQLLRGAKADVSIGKTGRAHAQAFTARNDHAFDSETIPLSGLATLTKPLHPDIVVGSDQLYVVTLDRHTGLVIAQNPLVRNVDYAIDYATGILRFINIPLPYDANFDPQVVSLQYEYQGPGVQSETTGGQVSYALSRDGKTSALASYVNDATGSQNFALAAQSITRTWAGGSLSIAHATSAGALPGVNAPAQGSGTIVPGSGSATSVSLTNRTSTSSVAAAYQATSAGYDDPFGGFSAPGVEAYRGSYARGTQASGLVTASLSGERNNGVGTASSETDMALRYVRSLGRFFVASLGFAHHAQSVASNAAPVPSASTVPLAATAQTQVEAALQYKRQRGFGFAADELVTVNGSDVGSTQPSQTTVEASYTLPKQGRIFLRELWSDQPSASFANSTANLNIAGGSTHSTQFGIEQQLSPATTIASEYVMNQTASGLDVYDALGIDEKLKLGSHVTGNLQTQGANAVGNGAQGFLLLGGALAYSSGADGVRASISYQDRTGANSGSTLAAAIAGHLSPNLATMGFVQRAYGNGIGAINDRISLAYRPLLNDRLISLFDYTRTNGVLEAGEAANVISFEELYRPTESTEIAGRAAYKLDGGGAYAARTTLWSARVRQHIGRFNDIGAEVRTVNVPGASGARQTQLAVEAGRTIGRTARAALGYNISGSVDPTLLGTPQRRGFYATFTTLIDRLFGWGKP